VSAGTTVESTEFIGTRAGIVTRTAAAAIDLGVVLLGMLVSYFAVAGIIFVLDPRAFSFPRFSAFWLVVIGELLLVAYMAWSWANTGRTVGKRLLGLRLVDSSGRLLGPGRATLRATICTLFPLSLFWCAIDGRNRALHDVLLRTIVVYDWALRTVRPIVDDGKIGHRHAPKHTALEQAPSPTGSRKRAHAPRSS
jgi:uncharacterized RDD family membrane protein YckC